MKRILALTAAATVAGAHGASVNLPADSWSTSYSDVTGTATVNEMFMDTYDLSDLTGLSPGLPIVVSFVAGGSPIWVGQFAGSGTNPVTANFSMLLEISAGGFSDSTTQTDSVGPVPAGDLDEVVGFNPFDDPIALSFEVPWGTDLSAVKLKLTDQSFFTGTGAVFTDSSLSTPAGTLTTVSGIPEPGVLALAAVAAGWCFVRRRRR